MINIPKKVLYTNYILQNKSSKQLAQEFNLSEGKIYYQLKKYNLFSKFKTTNKILTKEFLYDNYITCKRTIKEIAQKTLYCKSTIRLHLIKNNISLRKSKSYGVSNNFTSRKYKEINLKIFKVITPNIAYLLGFLAGDGNISKEYDAVRIELQARDKEILIKIKKLLKINNPLRIRHKEKSTTIILNFYQKGLRQSLARYEILPNKSKIIKFPHNNLPNKLYRHYLRGLFDADGCISISKKRRQCNINVVSASKSLSDSLHKILLDNNIQNTLSIQKKKPFNTPLYKIAMLTNSVNFQKIYKYLYKDSNNLFLKRKKKKFDIIAKRKSIKIIK